MLRLRSPHSRRLWRAAWSGDEQRFRSKFDGAESRRDLILEVDPTSGWSAPHFAAVYDRVGMLGFNRTVQFRNSGNDQSVVVQQGNLGRQAVRSE